MANLKNLEKRVKFTKDNQPPNRGRKKNVFTQYKEQFDLSADDVSTIIAYLCSLNIEELSKISADKKTPAIVINFARALLVSIKKGELNALERMLDRKVGKPDFNFKGSIGANEDAINEIKKIFNHGIEK